METQRIFISIKIPQDLRNTLEAVLEPFYSKKLMRVSDKDSWHITVAFLGDLNETEISVIQRVIEGVVTEVGAFTLSPTTVSFAPDFKKRMVWLNFKYSVEFIKLKNLIADEIEKEQQKGLFQDFKRDKRSRLPHLTLARFENRHMHEFKNLLPENGESIEKETKPFQVESLEIMKSKLKLEGAEHEEITSIQLNK